MSRLTNPDDQVGMEYVLGSKGKRYFVPSIQHVDAELADVTMRVTRWTTADKFPDLVECLTADRDKLLDRRCYLMLMGDQEVPPVADLGTDRGLIR